MGGLPEAVDIVSGNTKQIMGVIFLLTQFTKRQELLHDDQTPNREEEPSDSEEASTTFESGRDTDLEDLSVAASSTDADEGLVKDTRLHLPSNPPEEGTAAEDEDDFEQEQVEVPEDSSEGAVSLPEPQEEEQKGDSVDAEEAVEVVEEIEATQDSSDGKLPAEELPTLSNDLSTEPDLQVNDSVLVEAPYILLVVSEDPIDAGKEKTLVESTPEVTGSDEATRELILSEEQTQAHLETIHWDSTIKEDTEPTPSPPVSKKDRVAQLKASKKKNKRSHRSSRRATRPKEEPSKPTKEQELEQRELQLKQRATIANEILQTERVYVTGLTILIEAFLKPMRTKNLITPASLRRIFSDVEVLFGFNCQFLSNVELRMLNWDANDQRLGDIFLREVDYLKMYTMYVNNYNDSVKEVAECRRKHPKFAEFLDAARYSETCNGLDLTSYLIMPVQRIPRYVLLLVDLLKKTPEDHADFLDLKAAVEKTKEVADYVNEKKREAENLNKVVAVQEKLGGKIELLEDASRRYVREGPLMDLSDKQGRFYFFLFNDILVASALNIKEFTTEWKKLSESLTPQQEDFSYQGALKYKYLIPLSGAGLKETSQTLQNDPKFRNMFQLVVPDSSGEKKHYSFVAPTFEMKSSWMADIDECITQQLEIRKIRAGPFAEYDLYSEEGLPQLSASIAMQNLETLEWNERYLVLRDGILFVYKNREVQEVPKLRLELYSCSVRLLRPSERDFSFQVLSSQQIYYFAANNGEQVFDWIYAIRSSVEYILHLKDQQRGQKVKSLKIPPALAQMLTDPENHACADCRIPDPQWVNITRGVFVCDVCYNIHKMCVHSLALRNLSRHAWSDDLIKDLLPLGNQIVNQQLEANLQAPKITSGSPHQAKVDYIREKYDYPEPTEAPTSAILAAFRSQKLGQKAGWLVLLDDNETKKFFYLIKKNSLYYYKSEVCSWRLP